jgi:ArsR family transcriptional regulator
MLVLTYVDNNMYIRAMHATRKRLTAAHLAAMASALRVLAHPQRLRVVEALEGVGELPVRDIVAYTGLPQAAVSHHLARMRSAGLVVGRRLGRDIRYRVANASCFTILDCIRRKAEGKAS